MLHLSKKLKTYKKTLRFLYNNYQLTYEGLIRQVAQQQMLRDYAFYVWRFTKTITNLNPSFTKQSFELRETNRQVREKSLIKW